MNKKKEYIVKKSKKTPINLHTSCNVIWYVHVTNEVSIFGWSYFHFMWFNFTF